MTIELRVPGRVQTSQMSCWWASMAMVLEYYGRDYTYPWQFNAEFARPWNQPDDGIGDMVYGALDPTRDPLLIEAHAETYLQPYEWYRHGLPESRAGFARLRSISGFRGFDRPAFGAWTAEDVESRLRSYGPYVFFGSWNGFPHAIVTVGLITRGSESEVVTIDPIRGFATNESLASFNQRMASNLAGYNFASLNPMYYPQPNPVRAVVNHDG
ncbi:MAG: hypothetical protein HZC37_13460 [Burkholderiales bacterium]|nr:hypothetical protein [Burkholderiales bacterium]